MPKWDCAALKGPWGSLWPACVMNDHHQAIIWTYGLPWGSTTCRNTSGDASNGVCAHLCLWIYGTIWTWCYGSRTIRMTGSVFSLPQMYIWRTLTTSVCVCVDYEDICPCQQWFKCSLNRPQSWRRVKIPSIWHQAEFDWCWLVEATLCVYLKKKLVPTCRNSNSKPVCLS